MRTRLFIVGWLLWLPLQSTAFAADRSLSVTISAADLALIQDRRDIEIKGGRVLRADHPLGSKNGRPIFRLTIPANETATLRYQTEHVNTSGGRPQ